MDPWLEYTLVFSIGMHVYFVCLENEKNVQEKTDVVCNDVVWKV
jgi:hypothetical protein